MTRKEAIAKIREAMPTLWKEVKDAIQILIPELKESEDERIRNEIIDFIEWAEGRGCIRNDYHQAKRPAVWIAYLEKQKAKERLDRMAPIYNDKESFESALEKAWKYYNESASRTVDSFEDDYIECVFSKGFREGFLYREKQKEQKHDEDDFTIYHPLKNGKGKYECIPYSFYGSLNSFSEDKDLIDFLRTCFYTEEECNEWIEQQKEQKQQLPLMGGDTDTYFDDLRMTTKPLTSREWFNEGIKYAQRLQKEQKPEDKEITLTNFEEVLNTFLFDFANSPIEDCEPKEYIKKHSAEILKAAYTELNAQLKQDIFKAEQEGRREGYEVAKAEQKPAEWSEKHIANIFEKVGLAKIAREKGNDELTNALQDAMLELSKVENTEWSDTDNIGWDEALACVTKAEKSAKNEEELQNAVTAEKWLKEIKFKYCVHPVKQEWSEEDEDMYKMVSSIVHGTFVVETQETQDKLLSWLKSLRH